MLKHVLFFVSTLLDAQKHLDGALMSLQVLQQRVLAVDTQAVHADEPADGLLLACAATDEILAVVVELPVEQTAQRPLDQPCRTRTEVVPEGRVLLRQSLDAPAGRQPDGQVRLLGRLGVLWPPLHQLPDAVVEVERVGDTDASRQRIHVELLTGLSCQVWCHADAADAALLILLMLHQLQR